MYKLFIESSCDLTHEELKALDINLIPLKFICNGEALSNDEMGLDEFYKRLRAGEEFSTSAANISDYLDAFTPALEEGYDILHLAFSSGLSSSCQNAKLAAEELSKDYPDRKIYVVDSLCASMGHGLFGYLVAKKKEQGADIEEAKAYAEDLVPKISLSFTVQSLDHLHRGGRISGATALFGNLLGIKPLCYMNEEGKILMCGKVRGTKNALKSLYEKITEHGINLSEQTIFISHADDEKDAQMLADMLKDKVKEIHIGHIGPVIGSHCGPDTIALFFISDKKV